MRETKFWIGIWVTIIVCLIMVGIGLITEIKKLDRQTKPGTKVGIPYSIPDPGHSQPQEYQIRPLQQIEEINHRLQERNSSKPASK